jgi:DNA processing protein
VGGVTVSNQERLARVGLARVTEPGSLDVWAALQAASAEQVWASVRAGEPLGRLGQRALDGLAARLAVCDPQRDLEQLDRQGARVLCPGDDEWPGGLVWEPSAMSGEVRGMAPPFVLFAEGPHHVREAMADSVAVVGARAATAYGTHVAKELGFALAEAGLTVVSGGAYGIDAAAHRGALASSGAPTVAVLACGLDLVYPRGNDRLLGEIRRQGLLLSELPPGCGVTRLRFLVRNRVVAAMTQGTVVVEAAERSGSLSTSGRAADLGRHVMAVPGPVTSAMSTGTHQLLRQGCSLVAGVDDVLEVVRPMGEHLTARARGPVHPRDRLEEQTRRILDALPVRRPVSVARIAAAAGVSTLMVQVALPELLGAGLVEQRDGGWRLTTLGASG